MKLKFKQREIVIAGKENQNSEEFTTGTKKVEEAIILFCGEKCELNYAVGDKILFKEATVIEELVLNGESLRIMDERMAICQITD